MTNHIFENRGSIVYYRISNSHGKVWYIPDENCRLALNLYQPSSMRGKLLKSFFPLIKNFSIIRSTLRISVNLYEIQELLRNLLYNIFNTDAFVLSLFCGTPSIHKKDILQVTSKNQILGYCKLSSREDVKKLLRHEELILHHLSENGITGIPTCYFHNELGNDFDILIQSTSKTGHSNVIHHLTDKHWDFLNKLNQRTKQFLSFEETDFNNSLMLLKANLNYLPVKYTEIIIPAISEIEKHYTGLKVEFSLCHADFTPWNMFLEKGELFVFDWEYAVQTCPPFMDAFHFFTQTHIYVKHSDSEKIFKSFNVEKNIFEKCINDPVFVYKNYLLFIISFYVERDKGEFSSEMSRNISIWTNLLRKLEQDEENR